MKNKIALFLIIFMVGLVGCNSTATETIMYDYTTWSIDYADGSYSFQYEMDNLQTMHAQYYFTSNITDSERRSCVEATEQILGEFVTLEELPTICVLEIEDSYISDHTLYLSPQDWCSIDFTTKVLLAASGQCSHYGLAYGYANMLCDRFGWSGSSLGKFATTDESAIYDLNYLCFDNDFSSESNIATAKSVSADFVITYISEVGEDIFQHMLLDSDTTTGMENVANALSNYCEKNGQIVEISTVRYGFGGVSNDYIVSSDYALFYVCKDWTDQSAEYNSGISKNFLHEKYQDVRDFFIINLEQMRQYQELFALNSYDNDLTIIFTNSTTHGNVSMYYLSGHIIYLKSIMDFTHEYIHSLTIPSAISDLDNWSSEGLATYFAGWYDFYSRDFLNHDYNSASYLEPLRTKLGRPLDVVSDNDEILNYTAHYEDYVDPNKNYLSGASFVSYLVDQYGVDNVVQYLFGSGEPLPKSYTGLVNDWLEYLDDAYEDL